MANFCSACGKPLTEGAKFCSMCGAKVLHPVKEGAIPQAANQQSAPAAPVADTTQSEPPEFAFQSVPAQEPVPIPAPEQAQQETKSVEEPPVQPADNPQGKGKFDWSWFFKSAGFIFGVQLTFFILGGLVLGIFDVSDETFLVGIALVSILGVFSGAALSAYVSPGHTVYEPAAAAAALSIVSGLLSGQVMNLLFGWLLALLIALGGAKAGEAAQARRKAA